MFFVCFSVFLFVFVCVCVCFVRVFVCFLCVFSVFCVFLVFSRAKWPQSDPELAQVTPNVQKTCVFVCF